MFFWQCGSQTQWSASRPETTPAVLSFQTDFPDVLSVFISRPEPLSLRVLAADFRQPAAVGVTLTDLVLISALRRSSQRGALNSVQAKPPGSALPGFCAWDWAPCQAPHPQSDIRLWTLKVFLNPISCLIIWRR